MTAIAFVVIVAVYVAIVAGVTYWLTRFGTSAGAKWAIAVTSLFAFLALAVWDEVWGYIYLRHLCATESGIKVYRTVTLGPEYWNADGSPKFISFKGESLFTPFLDGGRYQLTLTGSTVSRWPHVTRSQFAVTDLQSKDRLAERVTFFADRGWLLLAPGWHVNRRSCSAVRDVDQKLISSAFRRASSK